MYKKKGEGEWWEKRKVIIFERRKVEVIDFNTPYKVNVLAVGRCEVVL